MGTVGYVQFNSVEGAAASKPTRYVGNPTKKLRMVVFFVKESLGKVSHFEN